MKFCLSDHCGYMLNKDNSTATGLLFCAFLPTKLFDIKSFSLACQDLPPFDIGNISFPSLQDSCQPYSLWVKPIFFVFSFHLYQGQTDSQMTILSVLYRILLWFFLIIPMPPKFELVLNPIHTKLSLLFPAKKLSNG